MQKALTDIDNKKARLVQRLEDADDFEGSLFDDIRLRHQNLSHEREEKLAKQAAATEALASIGVANSVELLEQLPLVDGQLLLGAPEARLRAVFDALRLRVVYDGATGLAEFRAVVADDTLPAVRGATAALSGPERLRQRAQAANGAQNGPTGGPGRHRGPALTGHDAPDDCFPSVWCPR